MRAIQESVHPALDCFAELVIGPATSGPTRWPAMTIGYVDLKASCSRPKRLPAHFAHRAVGAAASRDEFAAPRAACAIDVKDVVAGRIFVAVRGAGGSRRRADCGNFRCLRA